MKITPYSDPAAFVARVQPYLEANEPANSLILGISTRLVERPDWTDAPPYLAVVENEQGELALIAVMTPPFHLLLAGEAQAHPNAYSLLINHLRANWTVTGVNAIGELSQRFAGAWAHATGQSARVHLRMRAYEVRQVIPPSRPPSGCMRVATLADLDTLAAWRAAFEIESLHEPPPENNREIARRSILAESSFIWEDNGPVSMAVMSRPTAHGASIGGVYTPPEYRARGYASACVAALSQRILDSGKQFAGLFTDLDYPTSNSIYQKIGYRPVCDFVEYAFE